MSRSARLLELLQLLRRHRQPVSGQKLAAELGVSLRTIYRDIETLNGQGAEIDGEAGVGFVLRPGFLLPPLMLTEAEAEVLALGLRWVAGRGDAEISAAAAGALAKIAAILPPKLGPAVEDSPLLVPSCRFGADLSAVRRSLREERVVVLRYCDAEGAISERKIWPIALAFFDRCRMLAAFCELRGGFRHFRLDRIVDWRELDEKLPRRRRVLAREWREAEGIDARSAADRN